MKLVSFLLAGLVAVPSSVTLAQRPERGRDLGIPFEGTPGPLDAITDVGGVGDACEATNGRCRWWRRRGTAGSTTSTAFTSRSRMPGPRWTVPAAVPSWRAA